MNKVILAATYYRYRNSGTSLRPIWKVAGWVDLVVSEHVPLDFDADLTESMVRNAAPKSSDNELFAPTSWDICELNEQLKNKVLDSICSHKVPVSEDRLKFASQLKEPVLKWAINELSLEGKIRSADMLSSVDNTIQTYWRCIC